MVAGTLLAVGVTASLAGFDTARKVATHNRHMTQSINVAESVAEQFLVLDQSDDQLDAGAHTSTPHVFNSVGEEVAPTDPKGVYSATWNVQANVPIDTIRRITITVAWNVAGSSGTTGFVIHRR